MDIIKKMKTDLDNLIEEYTEKVLEVQSKESGLLGRLLEKLPIYNKESADLYDGIRKNGELADRMYEASLEEGSEKIINRARKINPSYKFGLAIGYLFPEENFKTENSKFDSGLKKGQVYRLKNNTYAVRKKAMSGLLLAGLGSYFYNNSSPYIFSEENLEINRNIYNVLDKLTVGSFLYGLYPMLRHKLFCNDMNPSKKLVTSGQFSLHRNPFYFGLMGAFALVSSKILTTNFLSDNPNWLAAGVMGAGLGLFAKGAYDYTIQDEKILEKQFGEEYREYKDKTPRFFPNLLNLFRRKNERSKEKI